MFHFLETDIREPKKFEMRTQKFFFQFQILKKHRYASAKISNVALVKLTD